MVKNDVGALIISAPPPAKFLCTAHNSDPAEIMFWSQRRVDIARSNAIFLLSYTADVQMVELSDEIAVTRVFKFQNFTKTQSFRQTVS